MSEIKKINEAAGYAHATVGNPAGFIGKVFCKDAIGATSCEISFGSIAPREAIPFFHDHKENEEIYIFLSGEGRFQVDDTVFDVAPGSIVRVSTGHSRCIKNTSDTPLINICIQAKQNCLTQWVMEDALITEVPSLL